MMEYSPRIMVLRGQEIQKVLCVDLSELETNVLQLKFLVLPHLLSHFLSLFLILNKRQTT